MAFETTLTQERIDQHTRDGYWVNRTITDYLDEAAAATPDKVAFIDPRRQITYAELRQQVDRCALGLLELGVRPGDVVSFQLPNWIEWVVLHYAATRIGAISNPLIPIYREREVGFMVGLAQLEGHRRAAGVPRLRLPRDDRQAPRGLAGPRARARRRRRPRPGHAVLVEFMATPWEQRRDPAELAGLRPDPNDVTLLIFTSGTTGEPKGVMHTHNTLVAANNPLPERVGDHRRQRDPHGVDAGPPDRLPLRGPAARAGRRDRGAAGRVGSRPVRRARRGAPHHLHLGGDAVPVRPARPRPTSPSTTSRRWCGSAAWVRRSRGPWCGRPGRRCPAWWWSAAGGRPRRGWSPSASPATPTRSSSTPTATRSRACGSGWSTTEGTELPAGHRRPGAGHRAVRVRRLRRAAGHDPGALRRRVVRHRRPGDDRRRGLPQHLRPDQGRDHPRRGEHPGRLRRERALRAPADRRGRGRRRARPAPAGTRLRLRRAPRRARSSPSTT